MTFLDDASKRVVVYFLKNKNQTLEAFKSFKAKAERQTGKKVKTLRSDNGLAYVNAEFRKVLDSEGIRHQTTCPYTPQQNSFPSFASLSMHRAFSTSVRFILSAAPFC